MYNSLRNVAILFAGSIVLLGMLSFSAYHEVRESLEYAKSVERIHIIQHEAEQLGATLKELENSHKGYVFTKEDQYLNLIFASKEQISKLLASLQRKVKDNESQLFRLESFKRGFRKHIAFLNNSIRAIRTAGKVDNDAVSKSQIQANQMLRDLSSFQNYQKQLLSVRGMQKDQTDNEMSRKMFLFALFTVILLLVSFGLIFSELRKRITFQDELERKIEELKRSNSELEQFAYVASHDMQEPLRKIRAFSDMLLIRQRAVLNEDGKSTLQKIAKSSERLQNLINDLLAFSRLVNKNAQNVETVSLDILLSDVLKDLSMLTIEKNAIIEYDHLPTISGVSFQLHQLLLNLISNALKFSKNGIAPHITIRYRLLLGSKIFNIPEVKPFLTYHEITISDNGIGFEQEYADKIFMIFQRLHAKSQFEGTGIGLAVCKRVVTNHNGYIKAESVSGHGATFTIYLPNNRNEE